MYIYMNVYVYLFIYIFANSIIHIQICIVLHIYMHVLFLHLFICAHLTHIQEYRYIFVYMYSEIPMIQIFHFPVITHTLALRLSVQSDLQ